MFSVKIILHSLLTWIASYGKNLPNDLFWLKLRFIRIDEINTSLKQYTMHPKAMSTTLLTMPLTATFEVFFSKG